MAYGESRGKRRKEDAADRVRAARGGMGETVIECTLVGEPGAGYKSVISQTGPGHIEGV